MAVGSDATRWRTDGRFFRAGPLRIHLRAVTYGPFPGGWPADFSADFHAIAAAGFNAIRLYEMPDLRLLDAAQAAGLHVFGGLKWGQHADFFRTPALLSAARVALAEALRESGAHPALAAVYVANEIPADLVRWMGPVRVREALETLIALGREIAPQLMFAYANYPSTEYLEPENADFTAFNVYLEDESAFRSYLQRLQHLAGDRPLVVSEFGIDSHRNGLARQADSLAWGVRAARELETAGITIYAWSDRWWNAGGEVLDWDFGLVDRDGNPKPALAALATLDNTPPAPDEPAVSVIVCTRNGRHRIGRGLDAISRLEGRRIETIVVDDGSTDGTAAWVRENFPWARVLELEPGGLSRARNAGAAAALGEVIAFTDDDCEPDTGWIAGLRRIFQDTERKFAAAGGPNLPPPPATWQEAVVAAAPGAPSHVMISDDEAEHLPGCNLAVTKAAFDAIGGFDPQFHTAGDDVDFCWRLRDAGFRLGFSPGAFVWHRRRPTLRAFFRQQLGYGRAERRLIAKFPERFTPRGEAKWLGFVYAGGPVRVAADSVIYHGAMGRAPYQTIVNRMLPQRGLAGRFDTPLPRIALAAVTPVIGLLRCWARNGAPRLPRPRKSPPAPADGTETAFIDVAGGADRDAFLRTLQAAGWQPCGESDAWDLRQDGARVLLAIHSDGAGSRWLGIRAAGVSPQKIACLLETSPAKA